MTQCLAFLTLMKPTFSHLSFNFQTQEAIFSIVGVVLDLIHLLRSSIWLPTLYHCKCQHSPVQLQRLYAYRICLASRLRMASSTGRDASALPVPQEILRLICKNLDRSDLRNARLACKGLNDAAEIPLFRYIYLKRNMDSFCRLRMIASTPHLAKLTKGIIYSERLVRGPNEHVEHVDFDTWRRDHFGQIHGFPCAEVSDNIAKSCTTADLYRYYSIWCAHLHSQRLMQKFDIEEKDLEDAFSKLPQLEEIHFGPLFDSFRKVPGSPRLIRAKHFSSLGREMMVEPDFTSGFEYHVQQFTSMMTAAYKAKKKLKVIKARYLRWKIFQQQQEVLAMMIANMKYCEHFRWTPTRCKENVNGELQIGSMLRNAPRLRTIELYFADDARQPFYNRSNLSQVLVEHCHWPNLKTVQLHGFRVSDTHLRGFLAAHVASLTSLVLGEMTLTPYGWKGKPHHSSWIRFIIFLQESLNLRKMKFYNTLVGEGNENWSVGDADKKRRIVIKQNESDLTVKERVERYVVEGGEFPLPWPSQAEDESRWLDVLLDFRSRLDATWQYHDFKSRR